MTPQVLLDLAKAEGFLSAVIDPKEIPVDPSFRKFCEQNLCGQYGINYACPPGCGTPDELHQKLLAEETVLVLEMIFEISGYEDKDTIAYARTTHNTAVISLMEELRKHGYEGFCAGYNGCPLCTPCKCHSGEPCPFPEKKIICLSAYCVDVAELAKRCSLEFAWQDGKLFLFGMLALHRV